MDPRTLGGLEMQLYTDRPDLWAISKALKLAPTYKPEIWALLSESDKEYLTAYSQKIRAIKAQVSAQKNMRS